MINSAYSRSTLPTITHTYVTTGMHHYRARASAQAATFASPRRPSKRLILGLQLLTTEAMQAPIDLDAHRGVRTSNRRGLHKKGLQESVPRNLGVSCAACLACRLTRTWSTSIQRS
jgi:hypothetical protein